jgi:hypothetical protein
MDSVNQLLVVLITALVTGAVSISGIWLGGRLTRENEDRKWRRDRALEAYSELLGAVDIVRFVSDQVYYSESRINNEIKVVLDKVAEMDRISQRVFLLAPDAVNASMIKLTHHMGTEIAAKSIKLPKIEESERKAAMAKVAELLAHFRNEARNDLTIHPPLHKFEDRNRITGTGKPWWRFWR